MEKATLRGALAKQYEDRRCRTRNDWRRENLNVKPVVSTVKDGDTSSYAFLTQSPGPGSTWPGEWLSWHEFGCPQGFRNWLGRVPWMLSNHKPNCICIREACGSAADAVLCTANLGTKFMPSLSAPGYTSRPERARTQNARNCRWTNPCYIG